MNDDKNVYVKWQLLGISNLSSKPQAYVVTAKRKIFLDQDQSSPEKRWLAVTQQMGMSRLSNTKFPRRSRSPCPLANVAG